MYFSTHGMRIFIVSKHAPLTLFNVILCCLAVFITEVEDGPPAEHFDHTTTSRFNQFVTTHAGRRPGETGRFQLEELVCYMRDLRWVY